MNSPFNRLYNLILRDQYVIWILGVGFLIQLATCIIQEGHFHSDQHFQLIEFSSYQLGESNAAEAVWEFTDKIRPTIAIYLLSGIRVLCNTFLITDVFTQLLLLRLLIGASSFLLFNTLIIKHFAHGKPMLLYFLLIVGNFSWAFPYTRTLYSSEMLSSLCFFAAIARLDTTKECNVPTLIGIGGLISIAFFMRFQIAFASLGMLVWLLRMPSQKIKIISFLGLGFILVSLINIGLDSHFYHSFVITPWRYFSANIIDGKAASFGESSPIFYGLSLMLVTFAPPISVALVGSLVYGFIKKPKNIYLLCIIAFVIGHSLVAHKEGRFMFPIFGILPIGIGIGIQTFIVYPQFKKWQKVIVPTLYISFAINTLLIAVLLLIPYSQNVTFIKKINTYFLDTQQPTRVYCLKRTPYETQSRLKLMYYQNAKNKWVTYLANTKTMSFNSTATTSANYICTTFNNLKKYPEKNKILQKNTPILYSSKQLWILNTWLDRLGANTIVNIWALYAIPDKYRKKKSTKKCYIYEGTNKKRVMIYPKKIQNPLINS